MTHQKAPTTPPTRFRLGPGGGGLTGESAKNTRAAVWRLLGYLKPYRRRLVALRDRP